MDINNKKIKLLYWNNEISAGQKITREFNRHIILFNNINAQIVAISKNYTGTEYPLFNADNISSFDFDFILCSTAEAANVNNFKIEHNLTSKKTVLLTYDLNQISSDLNIDKPKKLFYETAKIEHQELISEIKVLNIVGKADSDNQSYQNNDEQRNLVKKIIATYKLAKTDSEKVDKPYQIGENWGGYLKTTRQDFYTAIENDDINKLQVMFGDFCRNCLSTGILGGKEAFEFFKNCIGYSRWVTHNFKVWKASLNRNEIDISELGLPEIGNPYGINIEGNIINVNSFLFHYRANFCKKILPKDRKSVILEIGGGFGGLGHYLQKTKTNCTYIDLDIPENLVVTEYFLRSAYPNKKILSYTKDFCNGIDLSKDNLLNYDIVLLPNYMLKHFADESIDLCINTISLGEMGYDTICEYLKQIDRKVKGYFYHENIVNIPPYTGYPVVTYPEMKTFKEINVSTSRWSGFDAYSKEYIYTEHLLIKKLPD